MSDAPALELRGITKRFGTLVANHSVDFELRRGEIHALLGENGAGKSTLMNVLYGLHQPDEGQILLGGEPVSIGSPRQAIGLGIGMVHQHFMLVPVMTVAENLVLGAEPRNGPLLDYKAAAARVRELSQRFGLAVDPDAKVEDIGVGTQQRVEILRALFRGAKVLVLDEPTAVLTAQEAQDLFRVLRTLTEAGTSVVFISHKLNEVLDIADRVTVLRRGEKIDTVSTEGATERSLATLMVGRDVLLRVEKADRAPGEPLLSLTGVSATDDRGLPAVNDLSLEVRAGEIVGLAGVDANGQSELIETIMGLRSPTSGTITVAGQDVTHAGPRETLLSGVSHIAEDRHRRGLVLEFDLAENLALRTYKLRPYSARGFISRAKLGERAKRLLKDYDVRGGGPETRAASLSGGNQQKVVIARELTADPKVIIAAQPTRGLDVGAIEFVHRRLVEERDAGRAVLLVSLEMEEIRSLSDRVLVIYEGQIVAELPPESSEEDFGLYMTGAEAGMSIPPNDEDLNTGTVTVASRLSTYLRGGGIIAPFITLLFSFFIGGLVVLVTGHDPIATYKAIFEGTGLNYFLPGADRDIAALNLQQTLIQTTPLILTGLAVAFAFRCGLFNIGGQGQYIIGSILAVWVGASFEGMPSFLHIVLCILVGILGGAFWAGIAGALKAFVGTNEVITTIMLNWIAVWIGVWVFNLGSPLQTGNPSQVDVPVSADIVEGAKLPVFWGDPVLQGLHVGIFIALAGLLVFWVLLNRTTVGYEVRAVGFSPDAAQASGISVARNYILVMAVCGAFAGLAGTVDLLGWRFRIATNDIPLNQVAFFGIAVALLGRNTAVGVLFSALLFGGLITGTSVRNLDPTVFEPALATNLTYMIQGMVVLFVSTDILVVYLLRLRRSRRRTAVPA